MRHIRDLDFVFSLTAMFSCLSAEFNARRADISLVFGLCGLVYFAGGEQVIGVEPRHDRVGRERGLDVSKAAADGVGLALVGDGFPVVERGGVARNDRGAAILGAAVLHDVGDSLNPSVDRGQVEGALVQGIGWLTGEELKWNDQGHLLSHSASTYAIPSFSDTPAVFKVRLLDHAPQPGVIHGSKAVGEPPFMLAFAVREALKDAVAAFGTPGVVVDVPSPLTHEVLFKAVQRVRG